MQKLRRNGRQCCRYRFEYCFKGLDISEEIQETVMTYYYLNEEEMPNMEHDNEMITLAEHLIRIF